ncbi:gluconate 2-dehydrogenase subunit 3 family protein [Maribacter sp. PR1]|uniref:Gluconate 2-dehydrogenase subunit 3 family protein n=1 Tax=Maribacter cobaltidurans TaxID=1178778 RepID=A0ABU7IZF7_9FLAO|nr:MULTISPECIES: gluconate 2-dehydrogenase subunit 3 family protein [Maribacter]MDC6390916.1 gluconate 2-dehydrogenase subunit 3 family protein [Maribacter sp. PR1]MEE1978308.1 gluconate 2-dehydrogenase subunit 3 family protein [Maribacter cobaltidurans]
MDRRKALKNMGLAMGYTVATPTLLSIMQSCKGETVATWTPEFLTVSEGAVLTKLVDIILPKTDTPSASEVQVDIFIDKFAKDVLEKEEQDFLRMAMGKFTDKALQDSGKSNVDDLTSEDLEPVLASSLKYTKEDEAKMFESITSYTEAVAEGSEATLDDETSRFAFANNLRGLTIWGYKTSEYVGEEVMAYLPVPGEYIPCADTQELTGGKAWSL